MGERAIETISKGALLEATTLSLSRQASTQTLDLRGFSPFAAQVETNAALAGRNMSGLI